MDEIRCPMCGKPNLTTADNCQFCDARLKEPGMPQHDADQADSFHQEDPVQPVEDNLPGPAPASENSNDWLSSLEELPSEGGDDAPSLFEDSEESEEVGDDAPSRLQETDVSDDRLTAATGTSQEDDLPDYLIPPDETTPTSTSESSDDWLSSLEDNSAKIGNDTPSWLEGNDSLERVGDDAPSLFEDNEESDGDGDDAPSLFEDNEESDGDGDDAPSLFEVSEEPNGDGDDAPSLFEVSEESDGGGDDAPSLFEVSEESDGDGDDAPSLFEDNEESDGDGDDAPSLFEDSEESDGDGDDAPSLFEVSEESDGGGDDAPSLFEETKESGDDIPDWLSEIEDEPILETVVTEIESAPSETSGADWLAEPVSKASSDETSDADWLAEPISEAHAKTGDDTPSLSYEAGSPNEIVDDTPPLIGEPASPDRARDKIPDWLSEFEEEQILETEKESAASQISDVDWLSEPVSEVSSDETSNADWLAEPGSEAPADETSDVIPDGLAESDDELPVDETTDADWLAEPISESLTDETSDAIPDGLAESNDEPPVSETTETDWLAVPISETPTDETSDVDWLTEPISEAPADETSDVIPGGLAESDDKLPVSETTDADWLAEPISETPTDETSDADWLTEPVSEASAEVGDGAPALFEEIEEPNGDGDNIPDWFSEIEEESSPDTEGPVPIKTTSVIDAPAVAEGTPDWLMGEGTDDLEPGSLEWLGAIEPEPGAPTAVEAEIPGWLQQAPESPPQPETPAEFDSPEWLDEAEAALPTAQTDKTVVSGIPEWLIEYEASVPTVQSDDWLSILTSETGAVAPTTPSTSDTIAADPETEAEPGTKDDVDWSAEDAVPLSGVGLTGAATMSHIGSAQEGVVDFDAASWDADDLGGDDAPSWLEESETPAKAGDDTPSWLEESETPAKAGDDTPSLFEESDPIQKTGDDIPFDFASLADDKPATEDIAPSWLDESDSLEKVGDVAPSWPQETEMSAEAGDGIPFDFASLSDDTPTAGNDTPSWLGESDSLEKAGDDAPSWLQENETSSEAEDGTPSLLKESDPLEKIGDGIPFGFASLSDETPTAGDDASSLFEENESIEGVGDDPLSWLEETKATTEADDETPSLFEESDPLTRVGDDAPFDFAPLADDSPAIENDAPSLFEESDPLQKVGDDTPSWLDESETPADAGDDTLSWLEETKTPADVGDDTLSWLEETKAPEGDGDGTPSWLDKTDASAELPDDDLPDWLAGSDAAGEFIETGSEPETPPDLETTPSWLDETASPDRVGDDAPSLFEESDSLEKIEDGAPSLFEESDSAGRARDDTPSLFEESDPLEKIGDDAPSIVEGIETSAELPDGELPDWLAGSDAAGESIETGSEPETPSDLEAVPSWLDENASPDGVGDDTPSWPQEFETPAEAGDDAPSIVEDVETSAEPGDAIPDWMNGMVDNETYRDTGLLAGLDEQEEIEPGQETLADSDPLPNWLEEPSAFGETDRAEPAFEHDDESLEAEPHPLVEDGLDGWLDEPQPEGAELTPSDKNLDPAELPGWLQAMRPVEVVAAATAAAEDSDLPIEKAGPLAGLRGVLPGEELTTRFLPPPVYSSKLKATDRHRAHFALLETLMIEETRPRPIESAPATSPGRTLRMVVGLVMAFILLIPLLTGMQQMPLPTVVPVGVQSFYDLASINLQQVGAPVLLAVEYEPAYAGEITISASGVVEQLLRQQARVTVVSTSPTGPALGEDLLQTVSSRNNLPYDMNQMMVNLGYLPGGSASLQAFTLDPARLTRYDLRSQLVWGTPGHFALNGISNLSDYFLVIVLTDNPDTARGWIEQVEPLLDQTPFLMVTSAQTAPMVAPYSDSGQLDGIVSGLSGGVSYELLMGQSGQAQRYWDAYQIGLIMAVTLTLAGALYYTLLAPYQVRGRRRRKG
jgi:hypothetical protein